MLKGIANKIIKIVFEKILIALEELLSADLNGDGKIGKNEK